MVKILSKPLNLEKVVGVIKETVVDKPFEVFDSHIGRDEVAKNPTFFFYNENGGMEPTVHATQYKKDFVLMFVSREGAMLSEIEQFGLIERLRKCGLIFSRTEEDEGKLLDTEEKVEAVTFYFSRIIRVCDDEG